MHFGFHRRVRHPLYPHLAADPAACAPQVSRAFAGTLEELRCAASAGARATQAVFVLVKRKRPFLLDKERDFLWEAFQVPAYLLLSDEGGKILAYECEVQDGFHLGHTDLSLPGAILVCSPCECGRPGNRLQLARSANLESVGAGC
jgi:hypothetical protein